MTRFPKPSEGLCDVKSARSIETLMESAMEFGALYTQNAETDRHKVFVLNFVLFLLIDLNYLPRKFILLPPLKFETLSIHRSPRMAGRS